VVTTSTTDGNTGYVEIWNLRMGQRVGRWRYRDFGADAIYSPDGHSILTRSFLGVADLWRFDGSWHFVRRFGRLHLSVESIEFSRDGRRLLTTMDDLAAGAARNAEFARIWDTRSGKPVVDFRGADALGTSARFSPDGRLVVTSGYDRRARIWNAATGRPVAYLVGHQGSVNDARFSPDGRLVVTASDDGTARVWDVRRARTLLVLRGHVGHVATASFSADGRRVLTAGADKTARIWDVAGLLAPRFRGSISSIAVSADGTVAAVGGKGRATVWDVRRRRPIGAIDLSRRSPVEVVVSPDGRYVVAGNTGTGEAKLWDVRRRRWLARFSRVPWLGSKPFSADGTRLEVMSRHGFGVWDIRAKRYLLRKLARFGDSFSVVALSPDGRTAVTGQVGAVWAWNVRTGRGAGLFSIGALKYVFLAAFSPDGSRLVAGTYDAPVLWDVAKHRQISTLRGHTSFISHLSFSPDGRRILTAAGDETARLWDAETGAPIAVIRSHTEDVTSATFSPDGRFIATTSGDDAIRIADGVTGAPVAVVRTGRGGVFTAAFVGDTTELVTTHAGGRPWLVRCDLCAPLDELLALARRRITRDLTPAERVKYLHQ
jgi:WD40 repeat protein